MNLKNIVSIKNLLIVTIIGFITGFDFTDSWGCVFYPNLFFLTPLSILTLISIITLFISNKTSNSRLIKILLIGEFIFYVSRFILFKGGYAVGFTASPDPIILIYDAIALALRIFLLKELFSLKLHYLVVMITVFGLLYLKSTAFPVPPYYFYKEHRSLNKGRKIQTELIGSYTGNVQFKKDTININFKTEVYISIDSIKIEAQNFDHAGTYHFLLESEEMGLIRKDQYGFYFFIDNNDDEHLNFSFEDHKMDLHNFKLKKISNGR
ncbi:MAG: hypothetical protein DWQ02_25870 [Bacteroidetes bacterium]|nr:MAG: hypothetical protein DWQ02_25870 [Bacteroidota bacterium]